AHPLSRSERRSESVRGCRTARRFTSLMLSLHVRGRGALLRPKRLRKFSDLNFCAAKKHRSHPMLMPSLSSLPWMGVHPTGFEKLYRFAGVRYSENQERGVSPRFGSGVAIIDVDSLISEPRRDASEFPRTIF